MMSNNIKYLFLTYHNLNEKKYINIRFIFLKILINYWQFENHFENSLYEVKLFEFLIQQKKFNLLKL
jgi:hypothetical protein